MNYSELALNIYRHYRGVYPEVKHYYGIIANYGLVRLAENAGTGSEERKLAAEILDTFPDKIVHPSYNFQSYRVGGIAKARAVYDGICSGEEHEAQLRTYADELMTARRSSSGIIGMPQADRAERVWIDVATAVTPFLLFAGLHFGEPKYIDEAVFQTLAMYDLFLDGSCGLLHQSKNFCGEGKISADHWSRGNGWGILPLAELCVFLPDSHPEKPRCIEYFRRHLEALAKFQTDDGMWRQEITVESCDGAESYRETSGTGLILYALGAAMRAGIIGGEYLSVFRNGIDGLIKNSVNADFSTENCCPGCLCPKDGSIYAYLTHKKPYRDEPHGAGPVILALSEAALLLK